MAPLPQPAGVTPRRLTVKSPVPPGSATGRPRRARRAATAPTRPASTAARPPAGAPAAPAPARTRGAPARSLRPGARARTTPRSPRRPAPAAPGAGAAGAAAAPWSPGTPAGSPPGGGGGRRGLRARAGPDRQRGGADHADRHPPALPAQRSAPGTGIQRHSRSAGPAGGFRGATRRCSATGGAAPRRSSSSATRASASRPRNRAYPPGAAPRSLLKGLDEILHAAVGLGSNAKDHGAWCIITA